MPMKKIATSASRIEKMPLHGGKIKKTSNVEVLGVSRVYATVILPRGGTGQIWVKKQDGTVVCHKV